jgi:hydroxyacylglutathione hydrolase
MLYGLGITALLLGIGVIAMRAKQNGFDPPDALRRDVVHVRNFFTDLYGARIGDRVILFDGGVGPEGRALDALLSALKASRDQVSDVFLTHGHFDHVASAPLCHKARIHVGIRDTDMMAHKTEHEPFAARTFHRILPVPPVAATAAFLGERTEVDLGDGKKMVALPLPGHTPGSYVFVYEGILFAGDSIQISGGKLGFADTAFSVDPAENRRGIATLKAALGDLKVEQVCTGHQGCTSGDAKALLDELIEKAGRG